MLLELFVLLSGALLVGAVVGAWIATGRLFLARLSGPGSVSRWPVWLPLTIGGLAALVGLVVLSGQIITLSNEADFGGAPTPFAEQTAAIIVTMLLSPIWMWSMVQASLGMILHYKLGGLLSRLHPIIKEGLALGLRAAWATIALLFLLFGLQLTYNSIASVYRPTLYGVLVQMNLGGALLLNVLAIVLGLLTIYIPARMEKQAAAKLNAKIESLAEASIGGDDAPSPD